MRILGLISSTRSVTHACGTAQMGHASCVFYTVLCTVPSMGHAHQQLYSICTVPRMGHALINSNFLFWVRPLDPVAGWSEVSGKKGLVSAPIKGMRRGTATSLRGDGSGLRPIPVLIRFPNSGDTQNLRYPCDD
jgi:hypothetical protein